MPNKHKLGACANQCAFRIERIGALLKTIQPCLGGASEEQRQLLMQMAVVQLQSIMEAYFRCVVSLATYWDPHAARTFLAERRPDQADNIAGLTVPQLMSWMSAEVAFSDSGRPVKKAGTRDVRCAGVSGCSNRGEVSRPCHGPKYCGSSGPGTVGESDVRTVKSINVVVATSKVGEAQFYGLTVAPNFFSELAVAVLSTIGALEVAIAADRGTVCRSRGPVRSRAPSLRRLGCRTRSGHGQCFRTPCSSAVSVSARTRSCRPLRIAARTRPCQELECHRTSASRLSGSAPLSGVAHVVTLNPRRTRRTRRCRTVVAAASQLVFRPAL